jgi:HSP20 family protein
MPAVVRFDPAREVTAVPDINTLFGSLIRGEGSGVASFVPAMDVTENDDSIVLRADLPGMSEDDVEIDVEDRVLTISGERRQEDEQESDGYRRVERVFGRFSRSLTLPDGVDPERVEAEFSDGVLEVRIPKPEQRKPHRISIGKLIPGKGKEKQDDEKGEQS